MAHHSATATLEAPSTKQKRWELNTAKSKVRGRKQTADDSRPRTKTQECKPAPSQRRQTTLPKQAVPKKEAARIEPAARARMENRRPPVDDSPAAVSKPPRRTPSKPSPSQRQKTKPPPTAAPKPDAAAAVRDQAARLHDLVEQANAGDKAAMAEMRSMLDAHPEIWKRCGDLGRIAEERWLDALGTDALGRESIRRHIDKFKVQLAGPQPTDLEWLMAQEVAACWLAKKHAETAAATPGGSVQQAALQARRLESAQKAYLRAMKTLMMLRLECR
ncbi:MAG TPA: hypothetical protein VMS17_12795 [Gemmataceae bacterium]|nr:hypothetical protein [Gemmataceae bacterium]